MRLVFSPPRVSCSVDEATLEDQQSNQSHSSGPDTGAPPTQSHDERPDVPLPAVPADLDPEEDNTLQKVSRCLDWMSLWQTVTAGSR